MFLAALELMHMTAYWSSLHSNGTFLKKTTDGWKSKQLLNCSEVCQITFQPTAGGTF